MTSSLDLVCKNVLGMVLLFVVFIVSSMYITICDAEAQYSNAQCGAYFYRFSVIQSMQTDKEPCEICTTLSSARGSAQTCRPTVCYSASLNWTTCTERLGTWEHLEDAQNALDATNYAIGSTSMLRVGPHACATFPFALRAYEVMIGSMVGCLVLTVILCATLRTLRINPLYRRTRCSRGLDTWRCGTSSRVSARVQSPFRLRRSADEMNTRNHFRPNNFAQTSSQSAALRLEWLQIPYPAKRPHKSTHAHSHSHLRTHTCTAEPIRTFITMT